jgi:glucosamine-6-phosphate deaminase
VRSEAPTRELRVEQLPVTVFADRPALDDTAADDAARVLQAAVDTRGVAHAMFATGNSQLGFLDALVARRDIDWSRVVVFHMDEYLGIDDTHPASFARYIREHIAERVRPKSVHYLFGATTDAAAECDRYATLLRAHPLDLCCLGIGENGHLAFNDPPADLDDALDVKVVTLELACRRQQVGEGHFARIEDVPSSAITVTVPALLRAAAVLAIVPEARKAASVRRALEGPVDADCPASALRRCPHARLYLDAGSASGLGEGSARIIGKP